MSIFGDDICYGDAEPAFLHLRFDDSTVAVFAAHKLFFGGHSRVESEQSACPCVAGSVGFHVRPFRFVRELGFADRIPVQHCADDCSLTGFGIRDVSA